MKRLIERREKIVVATRAVLSIVKDSTAILMLTAKG